MKLFSVPTRCCSKDNPVDFCLSPGCTQEQYVKDDALVSTIYFL